jgi:hypothetical protein
MPRHTRTKAARRAESQEQRAREKQCRELAVDLHRQRWETSQAVETPHGSTRPDVCGECHEKWRLSSGVYQGQAATGRFSTGGKLYCPIYKCCEIMKV